MNIEKNRPKIYYKHTYYKIGICITIIFYTMNNNIKYYSDKNNIDSPKIQNNLWRPIKL